MSDLRPWRVVDLSGERFGRLLVINRAPNRGRHTVWNCVCDCGQERVVFSSPLRAGRTKSCGCLQKEQNQTNTLRHGMSGTPTYAVWTNMLSRCGNSKNPSYRDYGGRGITVCRRWRRFDNFLADMGKTKPGMFIDRINNDKGYSRRNCRWATRQENNANRRNSLKNRSEREVRVAA